jgi:hypothetical protein
VDANQAGIVEDLRLVPGCSVLSLAPLGRGKPDILVGYRGANILVEIKNPDRHPSEHRETEQRQQEFRDGWNGQVLRASSYLEILNFMTGNTAQ